MMMKSFLFLIFGAQSVVAFLPQNQHSSSVGFVPSAKSSATALSLSFDDLVSRVDHYEVSIPKPLGVVFGENPDPYFGLVVDDVSEGMNGGKAGLRIGDQLMAVNENVVVGKEFDGVMDLLQSEPSTLSLVMYRGPVTQLYTVLSNQFADEGTMYDDEDDYDYDDEDSQEVIMDENYESPVRIEVREEKPLTAGDVFKAIGKLGSMLGETMAADINEGNDAPPAPKKKSGFFGMGGETVQLDGNEARGYRQEKNKSDEF